MQQDTKIFYGLKELELLHHLCTAGKPKDVLAQIRKCGEDNTILKKKFFVQEGGNSTPVASWSHPFPAACDYRNYPVVRLLLEIGADPDADMHEPCSSHVLESPRSRYGDDPQLNELFKGGRCWWKVEYADAKKQELQDELKRDILKGEASEAVWLMMHGVRLDSPSVLADGGFGKLPRSFQEVVCRMGIPENRLQDFHSWLEKNCADEAVVDILETLLETKGDEGRESVETLLFSMELLGEDRLDELANSFFSSFDIPVKTSMLRHLINAYDASEHRQFIERTMAALFMEILCSCMGG